MSEQGNHDSKEHGFVLDGPSSCQCEVTTPDWWVDRQMEAWANFNRIPNPTRKNESWRFSNLALTSLEGYQCTCIPTDEDRAQIKELSKPPFENALRAVFAGGSLIDFEPLPEDVAAKGVIWKPLHQAAAENQDLLKKHFMATDVTLGSEKFAALHASFCKTGMLVYVPKGVEVDIPLCHYNWMSGDHKGACFPHILIVAEDNAKVRVFDYQNSLGNANGVSIAINDIILGDGAKVEFASLQNRSEETRSFQINSVVAGRDADVKTLHVNLGSEFARLESQSRLMGQGARSEMLSVAITHHKQLFDQRTLQHHGAPHTWSNLLYKNTLNHKSRTIFEGLIQVAEGAHHTDAYQTNRNLLLNSAAEADSMPGLEIANDDVKCSHGSTTGQISEEELFYLEARGIPGDVARHLIAVGFYQEVLDQFGCDELTKQVRDLAEAKFGNVQPFEAGADDESDIDETDVRQLQGTE